MRSFQKYCLLILFCSVSLALHPQIKEFGIPYIRNYERSSINAGAQTWMMDISKAGLAYFANNDGVIEFDGENWKKYPLPGSIVVRAVEASNDGKIYAGGFNQIGYLYPDTLGRMAFKSLTERLPELYRNFGEVWKIHELPYGIVFQSYKQLMIYNDGAIDIIKAPDLFHFSFKVNNELFINDQSQGLFRLAHDRLVSIPAASKLKGQLIWSIIPKGNNLLISTAENGIYEFDGLNLEEWKSNLQDLIKERQIYCGYALSEDMFAFGTVQDGLFICDSAGQILQHLNQKKGLQNNTVLSIKPDQYGNLWLGLDNGIDYVEINSPISYFTSYHNISAGYSAILHKGILYFGTNRGVFYKKWEDLNSYRISQEFDLVPGTQGQVWELKVVDETLFCGHNSGIFIISGTSVRKVSDVQGGWTFIQPRNRDDILICGTYTSLVKFEKESDSWKKGMKIKGFEESSRFLANAGKNMLWMTHGYLGVFRMHFNESYDSVIKVEVYNEKQGLPSAKNISVFEIRDQVVFTTENGFYKYDSRSNSFTADHNLQETFPVINIQKIYEDDKGNIWYFTSDNAGVFRLQEDGTYVNVELPFRELQGRFIKWFQFVYPLDEENVFFGTQDGFVHYAPAFPKNYNKDLQAFIRQIELAAFDSLIYHGGHLNKTLLKTLPYKYNQIRFKFAANEFENPENVQYATYMEGFEEDWGSWQTKAVRDFSNLPRGEYTFHVKAKNIFDTQSNVSSARIEILPPWYLQWWAYVVYLIIVGLLTILMSMYIRYRIKQSKKEEENRQRKLFSEREKQLKTETLEAEKEVIKLRNEKLASEMRQKDKELANNTMQMIQKSKSLSAIKKELNAMTRIVDDESSKEQIHRLIKKINREIDTENQWDVFEKHFESVHEEFLKKLKAQHPDLTPRELKLCAYLRLNISSKEIATLMNISTRGVEISRYRIRKKFGLDRDTNLTSFIMSF